METIEDVDYRDCFPSLISIDILDASDYRDMMLSIIDAETVKV
jgi:hypothetical protein